MSETFILNEIIALKQLGHTVIIAANAQEKENFHEEIEKYHLLDDALYPSGTPNFTGYKSRIQKVLNFLAKFLVDFIKRPLKTIQVVYMAGKLSSNIQIFVDSYLVARQVADLNVDIIHAPFAYLRHLEQAVLLSDLFRIPFTYAFRAGDLRAERHIEREKELMKKASRIITISGYDRDYCMGKFGIKNVEIIHSSIDVHKFQPTEAEKKKKIICVCRFVEQKGVEYLIEACKILRDKRRDFELTLVGAGPLKERYQELIKTCDLLGNVMVKGPLTQEEIKKELDDSMIFVLPCVIGERGERDVLPNVLKEAMAMEIPVITSNIPGIEELVEHNEHGLLVPDRNPIAIADAIERLFQDKELREKLGRQGRERIEKEFNAEKEPKKLERIFIEARCP